MTYFITVEGAPRPWLVWAKRSAPTPGWVSLQDYKTAIQIAVLEQVGQVPLLKGPVRLQIAFEIPLPLNGFPPLKDQEKRRAWMVKRLIIKRHDLTNLLKGAEDALTGLLYVDDCQVVETAVSKRVALDHVGSTRISLRELADWEVT
jgi:Holliday junction resolvase RusA-like endonuclease